MRSIGLIDETKTAGEDVGRADDPNGDRGPRLRGSGETSSGSAGERRCWEGCSSRRGVVAPPRRGRPCLMASVCGIAPSHLAGRVASRWFCSRRLLGLMASGDKRCHGCLLLFGCFLLNSVPPLTKGILSRHLATQGPSAAF